MVKHGETDVVMLAGRPLQAAGGEVLRLRCCFRRRSRPCPQQRKVSAVSVDEVLANRCRSVECEKPLARKDVMSHGTMNDDEPKLG